MYFDSKSLCVTSTGWKRLFAHADPLSWVNCDTHITDLIGNQTRTCNAVADVRHEWSDIGMHGSKALTPCGRRCLKSVPGDVQKLSGGILNLFLWFNHQLLALWLAMAGFF